MQLAEAVVIWVFWNTDLKEWFIYAEDEAGEIWFTSISMGICFGPSTLEQWMMHMSSAHIRVEPQGKPTDDIDAAHWWP